MYGKLVHRPPFGHYHHAPRPPFGEPREVGERYLGHPELTDYWIKPYLLEALKHYPRLDDECVVEGLWKFANTICLQNKHTSIRTPPTYDDPVTTHKIAFLDKDDIELGCIKFWRKVDSTFGIDMILNGRGISITGNNDDPTLCLVDTPIGDNKKQIVNIEYLEFSLSALQGLVDGLTDRIGALEDYKGQADSLIRDPNGNFRTVHTAIHNDSDDQNIPTCYAVYQYGKGISDALNSRIDNLPSVVDGVQDGNMHPVTSNAVADALAGISNTLNGLSSRISSIANDVAGLQSAINNSGGGSSGGSDGGSNDSYIFAYPSGTVEGGDMPTPEIINAWDIVTGDHIASAVEVSVYSTGNHPDIITYTIDQNSSLDSNSFTAVYWENEAVYNPTNLSSSDSYRCIVAPEVAQSTVGDGNTRPIVRVKAGVFQKLGGSGSGSGGDEGESSILYYHSNSPYLSGTIVNAATVDLGRSFDGMNINNSVSGRWLQTSEAVSVASAGSGSGSGRPTWRAHFREVS